MGQCEPKCAPKYFDLCSGRPGNGPENFSSVVRFIKTSKGLKWSLNSVSHPFIHFLCICLGFSFFFFSSLRPAGQRRPTHSTPTMLQSGQGGCQGEGGFWVGAEQQIKRKMIDIIYRLSAGLKGLESQGSPLKKIPQPNGNSSVSQSR